MAAGQQLHHQDQVDFPGGDRRLLMQAPPLARQAPVSLEEEMDVSNQDEDDGEEYESFGQDDLTREIEDGIESPIREEQERKKKTKKAAAAATKAARVAVINSSDEEMDDIPAVPSTSAAAAAMIASGGGSVEKERESSPTILEFSSDSEAEAAVAAAPVGGRRGRSAKTKAYKAIAEVTQGSHLDQGTSASKAKGRKKKQN